MKLSNPRIERLKELMSLEERRADLQSELNAVLARMTSLKDALIEDDLGNDSAAEFPNTPTFSKSGRKSSAPPAVKRGRMKRGALKDQILTALEAAGTAGVKVTELAKALSMKPVNVYSWFHSASKRYPQIKKLSGGEYRLEGKVSREHSNAKSTPAKTGKVSTTAKATTAKSNVKTLRSGRGELSQRILETLNASGTKGVSVKDLSSQLGLPYKNVYIWFATTGKKNSKVKKVSPGVYRLA